MNLDKLVNKVDFNTVARVAFIGVAILLVYRIAKRTKQNIDIYTYSVSSPTLSNVQIAALAQKIAGAWGGLLNDNEEAVYSAFRSINNMDDLILLMRAYSYKNENLATSITKRMSNKEVEKINTILSGKGINFRF